MWHNRPLGHEECTIRRAVPGTRSRGDRARVRSNRRRRRVSGVVSEEPDDTPRKAPRTPSAYGLDAEPPRQLHDSPHGPPLDPPVDSQSNPPLDPKNINNPALYLNRELTWLNFNWRVLYEAEDHRNPLLERIKFLSIVSSNLDEFFMKRIGGLKQQVGAGVTERTVDGRPHARRQQIEECYDDRPRPRDPQARAGRAVRKASCSKHGIEPRRATTSSREGRQGETYAYYVENIFPLVTPQATDPAHPFPFVSNLSLNLLVTLHYPGEPDFRRWPASRSRSGHWNPRAFCGWNPDGRQHLRAAREVMANNLDLLFPGMEIDSCELFRVTRNANTEMEEDEADDLLAMIETELRERKLRPDRAPGGRLPKMAAHARGMLAAELGLDEHIDDVFEVDGILGHYATCMELDRRSMRRSSTTRRTIRWTTRHPGHRPQHLPHDPRCGLDPAAPPVRVVRHPLGRALPARGQPRPEGARHQDDAVPHVGRLQAIELPDRCGDATASRSPWCVELKARFDEAANIRWANPWRGLRHPRHLRRRRPQDALQGDSRGAAGLRRPAPLRAHRDRQLPRRHGAPVLRPWA